MRIIADFSDRILKSLELYYKADIAESNNIILELVKNIGNNPFAVNSVIDSDAFPGPFGFYFNNIGIYYFNGTVLLYDCLLA